MMRAAIAFFMLAIIAALFGYSGLAGDIASIAQFLALLFAALFVASLVYGMITGRNPPPV